MREEKGPCGLGQRFLILDIYCDSLGSPSSSLRVRGDDFGCERREREMWREQILSSAWMSQHCTSQVKLQDPEETLRCQQDGSGYH